MRNEPRLLPRTRIHSDEGVEQNTFVPLLFVRDGSAVFQGWCGLNEGSNTPACCYGGRMGDGGRSPE